MTRYEIEDIRKHAETYHMPPNWQDVLRLCDAALGVIPVSNDPRPALVPYQPEDTP
jgi:hypothetical protein